MQILSASSSSFDSLYDTIDKSMTDCRAGMEDAANALKKDPTDPIASMNFQRYASAYTSLSMLEINMTAMLKQIDVSAVNHISG